MSSGIEDLLASNEEVQKHTSPSIMDSKFVKSYVVSAVFGIAVITVALLPVNLGFNNFYLLVLLIGPALIILKSEIERRFVRYYITSQQVIERRGIFSQTTESTMYENITDVKLTEAINERIFDVGDIKVNTAGHDGSTIRLRGLKDPESYKRLIEDNINNSKGKTGGQQGFNGGNNNFGGGNNGGSGGGFDDSDFGDSDFGSDEDFGF